jgi:hypothetical protein
MRSTMSRIETVRLRSGSQVVFNPNGLGALFEQILLRTLEADRTCPCPLAGRDAIALECDREVCFVAGQLTAVGVDVGVESLRNELCCWLDERSDGASSAAPDARA